MWDAIGYENRPPLVFTLKTSRYIDDVLEPVLLSYLNPRNQQCERIALACQIAHFDSYTTCVGNLQQIQKEFPTKSGLLGMKYHNKQLTI